MGEIIAKTKYSYSKIDTYEQCHFKFKLQYLDGHYYYSDNVATLFGSAIHKVEEDIANCIKEGKPIDYIELKNGLILKLAEIKHKFPKDYEELDKSMRTYSDKAKFYLEKGIYRLENFMKAHPTYEIVGAEIPFKFDFDDEFYFSGYIDRVFKDTATGKYLIQDIKSWAIPAEEEKLKTPLQFVVYSLAVKNMYGVTTDDITCEYDLPVCDLVQKGGTAGYINRGISKLTKLFEGIKANNFEPKPSPLCHWCNFCSHNENAPEEGKHLCPYFMHWTKENKDFSKENEWHGLENHQAILEAYHKKYNINQ